MTFMSTLTRFGAGGGAAIPDVTVATFADLPTTRPDGYLVAVTAQSGLSDVIVRWDDANSVWLLEAVSVAWSTADPLVFNTNEDGEWYNSGGITVDTANGATMVVTDRRGLCYRYNPQVPRDALAGGGTCGLWLLPQEYAGTPEVQAYTAGTESNATLALQGWTVNETGTGTVATDTTEIVFTTTGATGVPLASITAQTTLTTAQPCTIRGQLRGAVTNAGGGDQLTMRLQDSGATILAIQTAATAFQFRNQSRVGISNDALQGSGPGSALPNMSTAPDSIEIMSPSRVDITELRRQGQPYHAVRRNVESLAGTLSGFIVANFAGATTVCTMGVRNAYVLTW